MINELLTWDFRGIVQDYLAWGIGIAAILWGGGPERAAAATWLLLFELAPGAYKSVSDTAHYIGNIDILYASLDGLAAVVWIGIALYANRNYTLWIAGMQVLAVSAHLASGIAEPISSNGYAFMVIAPGWVQLSVLALGLVRHILRKRKFGDYRSWRVTNPQSGYELAGYHRKALNVSLGKKDFTWRDHFR